MGCEMTFLEVKVEKIYVLFHLFNKNTNHSKTNVIVILRMTSTPSSKFRNASSDP